MNRDLDTDAALFQGLKKKDAPEFNIVWGGNAMRSDSIPWLLKGLLPSLGLGFIFGESGGGKTFLALDLAMHLAHGSNWFGHKCVKVTPVVYIALEAAGGIGKRLQAWTFHGDRGMPDNFGVMDGGTFDLREPAHIDAVGQAIVEVVGSGVVIIIDTLNRATPGGDENSSVDMGMAVAGADRLQKRTGGLVLIVHHSGKDAAKGMRGHSSLFAAADVVISVKRDAGRKTSVWNLDKSKDAEAGNGHEFQLISVPLGVDLDGDPITSCAIEWRPSMQGAAPVVKPKGPNQRKLLDVIKKALVDEGEEGHVGLQEGQLVLPYRRAQDVGRNAFPEKNGAARLKEAWTSLQSLGLLIEFGSALNTAARYVYLK